MKNISTRRIPGILQMTYISPVKPLRFFFEKIFVENKKISKIQPNPIFAILRENHQVIISKHQLEGRNFNITSYFSHIIKVFGEFMFVQELREEIKKVKLHLNPQLLNTTSYL